MTTINMHMKFEIEIPKQTWLISRKPCHLQSPETEKSNMAARRPFWNWSCWKSIGSYPYTQVLCRWSLKLIFKAKVKLESGNQKIQYGRQAAILKVTSLKINRLLPMNNPHAYEIWNWNTKANLTYAPETMSSTGRRTDRRTDGQGESSIPPPPSNFVGRGYNEGQLIKLAVRLSKEHLWLWVSRVTQYRPPKLCGLFYVLYVSLTWVDFNTNMGK